VRPTYFDCSSFVVGRYRLIASNATSCKRHDSHDDWRPTDVSPQLYCNWSGTRFTSQWCVPIEKASAATRARLDIDKHWLEISLCRQHHNLIERQGDKQTCVSEERQPKFVNEEIKEVIKSIWSYE
jgi:hypothetical protein